MGGIASGFLKQLGSDIYNSFKKQIFRLINEKGKRHKDNLLSFDFNVTHKVKIILVRLLCCNPLEQDIDDIVKAVIPSLDKILTRYFEDSQPVDRVVFEKKGNSFDLLYGMRRDGFPLIPEEPTVMTIEDPTNKSNGTLD